MQNRAPFSCVRESVLVGCLLTLTLSACGTGSQSETIAAQVAAAAAASTPSSSGVADVQVAQLNRSNRPASTTSPGTSTTTTTSTRTPTTTTTTTTTPPPTTSTGTPSTTTTTNTGTPTTTTTTTSTSTPTTTTTSADGKLNSIDEVISDMRAASDRLPIAPAGWGALLGTELMVVDPGVEYTTGLPWGVVFEAQGGNTARNTRVQIRNIRFYVKRRSTGNWELISSAGSVSGAEYGDLSTEAGTRAGDVRNEPDGGISVRTGGGYCFHFWTNAGRARVPSGDIAGVFTTYQMRAILHDPNGSDDRDASNYVAYTGLDYWRNESASFLADYSNNPGSGHGRFKRPTKNWRPVSYVSMQGTATAYMAPDWKTPYPQQFAPYALTESQIRSAPPPLE